MTNHCRASCGKLGSSNGRIVYQPMTKKDSSKCNGYKIIMMMMKNSGCVVSINFLETKSHSYHAFLSLVF